MAAPTKKQISSTSSNARSCSAGSQFGIRAVSGRTLCHGAPLGEVFNDQMIMDVDVTEKRGGSTFVTISKPVLQRLVDGKTLGLAVVPLGAIVASFFATENGVDGGAPNLHFTTAKAP